MESEARKARGPGFEQIEDDFDRLGTIGQPAGLYWVEGQTIIAAHDSAAEYRLLARGGVLIATLRFDRDPAESTRHGHAVERYSAARMTRDLLTAGVN